MDIQWVVQDVDVVVCTWLRYDAVPQHGDVHAHQVGDWVVADGGLGVPELPGKREDTEEAQSTVENPDEEARPDEDVPFPVGEDLDMVVHGPESGDGEDDVGDEEDFVVGSTDTVEREGQKEGHGDGSQLAVPEVVLFPVT